MPYNARVYNVIIASPGDTKEVRESAKEIILEWNDIHSEVTGIVLLPLMFEDNVTPEISNKEPQENIDEQIGRRADLLVAMFWTKVGTPTTLYESGTIQEIEKHIDKKRPAMLYFSKERIEPSSENLLQIKAIEGIKEKYKGKSLYWEYSSNQEFRDLFRKHLSLKINQRRDFFTGYSTISNTIQQETNNLSYEAIELIIAVAKNDSQIVRNSNRSLSNVSVDHQYFGVNNNDASIRRYYDAIDELVENSMAQETNGDYVYIKTKGIDKAQELLYPLEQTPFTDLLKIITEFNQINYSSYPEENERVQKKRDAESQMMQYINNNSIPLEHLHFSLIGEFNEGKLVALMYYILKNPSKTYIPYIYSHYKKAKEPFSKHLIVDVIKNYKDQLLLRQSDDLLCSRVLSEYKYDANKVLQDKIEVVKNLLK